MALPQGRGATEWSGQTLVSQASSHLREVLSASYPEVAALASTDPQGALALVPGVVVRWTYDRPKGACDLGGVYDGDSKPPTITLRRFGNERRNNFTAMHEVGHHLLYGDEDWQYRVLPTLGDKARMVEEKIVNDFAATLLVPDAVVQEHLGAGVTAAGLCQMVALTEASATTCCISALNLPGERLVMLADVEGRIWYSDSNGMPYNPGKRITQPSLATAAERALEDGQHTLVGGEGIRYSTGWADTDVRIDVALHEGLVIAVATSTRPDSRTRLSSDWREECAACGEYFAADTSSGHCATCGDWKCPECRGCECSNSQAVVCSRCFLALSVVEVGKGLTVHEDC